MRYFLINFLVMREPYTAGALIMYSEAFPTFHEIKNWLAQQFQDENAEFHVEWTGIFEISEKDMMSFIRQS